jgi:predicted GH43/DUF377 family glycosyl hydrolase
MMQRKLTLLLLALSGTFFLPACRQPADRQVESADPSADTSWAILPFAKMDSVNPVLVPGKGEFTCPISRRSVKWEQKDVFNPAAVVRDGNVYLLYRAEDTIGRYAGTSRIGLAVSSDALHFSRREEPVLFPANDSLKVFEWEGGVEDPRVVETVDSGYVMTYTGYDGIVARLLIATSRDLVHWTKHGTVLNGKYKNTWSKSGAIVSRRQGSRIVAEKVNGLYWMYFGDTDLFLASSENLLQWTPLEENGTLKPVLRPRKNCFDSRLVESGPFGLITDDGIVLIYNGMNADEGGDPHYARGAYCAGQALFSKDDPSELLGRLQTPFMMPDRSYETEGQVNQVCFLEGMVPFKGRWFLYYGTADSKVAVAVSASSF